MSYFLGGLMRKRERTVKCIGKIKQTQMFKPNSQEWILLRINPQCENCNSNNHYDIDTTYHKPLILPIGKLDQIFRIICPNCKETIELDLEEFLVIKPFIQLNELLLSGKIDEYEYKWRLEKIESKFYDR